MNLYPISAITPLRDQDYYHYLVDGIRSAKFRIWGSIFSVNLSYLDDSYQRTQNLVKELEKALRKNIDIKILMGGEKDKLNSFQVSNLLSFYYFKDSSIPIRHFSEDSQDSSHSKYIVFDYEKVVLGSHNWGNRSLRLGNDDSVVIEAEGYNTFLANAFTKSWEESGENYDQ